jgi:glycerophosphoryl diester phosphodiesterase
MIPATGNPYRALFAVLPVLLAGAAPAGAGGRPFEVHGHRGAAGLAPENSIAAFERALELRVDTLEMDVQATRDRVLVVYHDPTIATGRCRRTDGAALRTKRIEELSLEEVRAWACAEGAPIPTLEQVLTLARDAAYPVRVNVELKRQDPQRGVEPAELAALLVETLDRTQMRGRALVQSFDAEALQALRTIAPEIPRSALVRDRGSFAKVVETTGASVLSPKVGSLRFEDVSAFHARGIAVIPWVVDDPAAIRRMIDWGVDGVITDRPDVAIEIRDQTKPGPSKQQVN